MGYPITYISRYAKIDPANLDAIGFCQYTQVAFNRKDLVKQMRQVGDQVVWTGLWVGRPFVDPLYPQDKLPIIKQDPQIVKDPCPPLNPISPTQAQILAKLRSHNFNV